MSGSRPLPLYAISNSEEALEFARQFGGSMIGKVKVAGNKYATDWLFYRKKKCKDGKIRHYGCPYTKRERLTYARRRGWLK